MLSVEQLLESLETGRDTSVNLQSEISQHLNTLAREVQALEAELAMVGTSERSMWRKRITQLQEQSRSQVGLQPSKVLLCATASFYHCHFLTRSCLQPCFPCVSGSERL